MDAPSTSSSCDGGYGSPGASVDWEEVAAQVPAFSAELIRETRSRWELALPKIKYI